MDSVKTAVKIFRNSSIGKNFSWIFSLNLNPGKQELIPILHLDTVKISLILSHLQILSLRLVLPLTLDLKLIFRKQSTPFPKISRPRKQRTRTVAQFLIQCRNLKSRKRQIVSNFLFGENNCTLGGIAPKNMRQKLANLRNKSKQGAKEKSDKKHESILNSFGKRKHSEDENTVIFCIFAKINAVLRLRWKVYRRNKRPMRRDRPWLIWTSSKRPMMKVRNNFSEFPLPLESFQNFTANYIYLFTIYEKFDAGLISYCISLQ